MNQKRETERERIYAAFPQSLESLLLERGDVVITRDENDPMLDDAALIEWRKTARKVGRSLGRPVCTMLVRGGDVLVIWLDDWETSKQEMQDVARHLESVLSGGPGDEVSTHAAAATMGVSVRTFLAYLM